MDSREGGEGERGGGRKDENENKGGKNNSSSIVQALASGVEVAPSRDGKVRHHLFLIRVGAKKALTFFIGCNQANFCHLQKNSRAI